MGEEYMTIDISLEEKPEFDKISWEMAKRPNFAQIRQFGAIFLSLRDILTRGRMQRICPSEGSGF